MNVTVPSTPSPRARLHPLMAAAAVSVIALSATGVASMTGWIGRPAAQPAPLLAAAPATAAPAAATLPAADPAPAAAPAALAPRPAATQAQPAPRPAAPVTKPAPQPAPSRSAAPVPAVAQAPSPAAYPPAAQAPSPYGTTPYGAPATGPYAEAPRPVAAAARDWATVESVRTVRTPTTGSQGPGIGAIAGTVLGGVLGHQVGGGDGRKVGAVVGAVGGGLLGHQVEQRVRSTSRHEATVRLDDGSLRTFTRDTPWNLQAGDRVRVVDGTLAGGPASVPAQPAVRDVGYAYGG